MLKCLGALNLLPFTFHFLSWPRCLTLLSSDWVHHRPMSLSYSPLLLLNTDPSQEVHAPLHLYIISSCLPRPTQSIPRPPDLPFFHQETDLNVITLISFHFQSSAKPIIPPHASMIPTTTQGIETRSCTVWCDGVRRQFEIVELILHVPLICSGHLWAVSGWLTIWLSFEEAKSVLHSVFSLLILWRDIRKEKRSNKNRSWEKKWGGEWKRRAHYWVIRERAK